VSYGRPRGQPDRKGGTLVQFDAAGGHQVTINVRSASVAFGPGGAVLGPTFGPTVGEVLDVVFADGSLFQFDFAGARLMAKGVSSASVALTPGVQGSVTFFDGTTTLGTATLSNGMATLTISTLAVGTHTITATYNVPANFPTLTSTSGPLAEVVNAAPVPPKPPAPPPPAPGIIAVGTDAGVVAQVQIFNASTHGLLGTLLPFGPLFTGGARVAVGDVTGDGVPDIIVGAGPGGGPEINVYDGRNFQLLTILFAFVPVSAAGNASNSAAPPNGSFFSFTGGVYVAVGDINGDGFGDIVVGAGGGPQVQAFSGKDFSLLANFYAFGSPSFGGGVRVAVGDTTGSGRLNIICGAGPGRHPGLVCCAIVELDEGEEASAEAVT
jgi:hypothetical protein